MSLGFYTGTKLCYKREDWNYRARWNESPIAGLDYFVLIIIGGNHCIWIYIWNNCTVLMAPGGGCGLLADSHVRGLLFVINRFLLVKYQNKYKDVFVTVCPCCATALWHLHARSKPGHHRGVGGHGPSTGTIGGHYSCSRWPQSSHPLWTLPDRLRTLWGILVQGKNDLQMHLFLQVDLKSP